MDGILVVDDIALIICHRMSSGQDIEVYKNPVYAKDAHGKNSLEIDKGINLSADCFDSIQGYQ